MEGVGREARWRGESLVASHASDVTLGAASHQSPRRCGRHGARADLASAACVPGSDSPSRRRRRRPLLAPCGWTASISSAAGRSPSPQILSRPRRSMRRFIRHVALAATLAGIATPALAQRGGRGGDSDRRPRRGASAHADQAAQVHDRRGHLALARPLARRPHDRLRAARRHLHDSGRRRKGDAPHERPAVRRAAALLARRKIDRLRERPVAVGQPLDHERRRHESARAHARERSEIPVADLHARRQVRRRVEGQRHLHVLRERRDDGRHASRPATRRRRPRRGAAPAVVAAARRRTSSSAPRRARTAGTSTSRCATAPAAATTRPRSAGRSACSIARRATSSRRRTPSAAACVPRSAPTDAGSRTRRATTPRRRSCLRDLSEWRRASAAAEDSARRSGVARRIAISCRRTRSRPTAGRSSSGITATSGARTSPTARRRMIPFTADVDMMIAGPQKETYAMNDSTLTVHQIRDRRAVARQQEDGVRRARPALVMDLPNGTPQRLVPIGERRRVQADVVARRPVRRVRDVERCRRRHGVARSRRRRTAGAAEHQAGLL